MHSIVGQGKVEQVLASKPEDRRALVEEAAGLGKFKRRRHRAELKLARVAAAGRARAGRRGGGAEAPAAARAPGDCGRARREAPRRDRDAPRANRSARPRRRRDARRAEAEERRDAAALVRRGAQSRLEGLLGDRSSGRGRAVGRRRPTRRCARRLLYRLRGGARAAGVPERVVDGAPRAAARRARGLPDEPDDGNDAARLEREAHERGAPARDAERERDDLAERLASRASGCARSSACSPSRRGFRPPRERSRSRAKARAWPRSTSSRARSGRWQPRFAPARRRCLPPIRRPGARAARTRSGAGLGSLTVLAGREPQELVGEFPVVPLESLLEATVPSVTLEGFGYDPARGELWFAGETAEAVLLELQARRRELAAEADDLDARARPRRPRGGGRGAGAWPRRPRSHGQPRLSDGRAIDGELDRLVATCACGSSMPWHGAHGTARALRGAAPRARRRRRAAAGELGRRAPPPRRGGGRAAPRARGGERARRPQPRSSSLGSRRRATRLAGRLEADGRRRAGCGRRPRRALRAGRAARGATDRARNGEPARAGGVRGGEGAPRRPSRTARGSGTEPRRARTAPRGAGRNRRASVLRDVCRGRTSTSRRSRDPVPGR